MATKPTPTITELPDVTDVTEMIRRTLNRGLMVDWINRDLMNRADCDVRRSVVLYDADRVFVMALGVSVTPDIFRNRVDLVAETMNRAGIRYYSIGVK